MNIDQYPTPRTDREVKLVGMLKEHLVGVGLCRDLERELSAMTAERDEAKTELAVIRPNLSTLRWHANAICAISGRSEHDITTIVNDIIKELTEARSQIAALRETLRKVELWYAAENIYSEHWKNARAILAATEPKETK